MAKTVPQAAVERAGGGSAMRCGECFFWNSEKTRN